MCLPAWTEVLRGRAALRIRMAHRSATLSRRGSYVASMLVGVDGGFVCYDSESSRSQNRLAAYDAWDEIRLRASAALFGVAPLFSETVLAVELFEHGDEVVAA